MSNFDNLILRSWQLADVEQIDALNQQYLLHSWAHDNLLDCFKNDSFGWVICDESDPFLSRIVAYLVISIQAEECQLLNLLVEQDYRRLGLARRLLNTMTVTAHKHNCSAIYLEVRVSNIAAISLYEKCNFVKIGVRKNYYVSDAGFEDALILSCQL